MKELGVVAVALAAFVLPAGARADGLPVLGVDVGSSGVAVPGSPVRFVTLPSGSTTQVAGVDRGSGKVRVWRSLAGSFTVPAVAYDGSAGGLSADGGTLVLIEPRLSFPRARTRFVVLSARTLKPLRTITLRGDFSFDAISPGRSHLYLIQYPSATDPDYYVVRSYDLVAGRLLREPVVDPSEADEQMRGRPLTRAMSPDGTWAYTLYDGAGATPFIHALDTRNGTAHCIDLDALKGVDLSQAKLHVGNDLTVSRPGRALLRIDTQGFRVKKAAPGGVDTSGVAAGLGALGAAAACVVVLLRRRRHA
jgi:hypothetical protein